MARVVPKKHLGQHFLKDLNISERIAESLSPDHRSSVLEIGPGTGVLTDFLLKNTEQLLAIDLDARSVAFLKEKYPEHSDKFVFGDFLQEDFSERLGDEYSIIGNFPYNISSQIFFRVLEKPTTVSEIVCMLQKEVAQRIAAKHGNKTYGILSVLLQAFYRIEYLFTVGPEVFDPPPKVQSGVIRLIRYRDTLEVDKKLFFRVVKAAFQMRRKTLRNALKTLNLPLSVTSDALFDKRAEQLSVEQFINLTKEVSQWST
ncbi:MAG: 16S rRNA (adenine(1518)-N(6)/adenine(1519)-N(6))-dimethyltransferase RsmA [Cyclobacteriaceae bacterium]